MNITSYIHHAFLEVWNILLGEEIMDPMKNPYQYISEPLNHQKTTVVALYQFHKSLADQ